MAKKILHLSLTKSIGGIASFQKNLFSHIDREKYVFEFVTTYKNALMIPFLDENGAKVHYLPSEKRLLKYCVKLYKIVKNGDFAAVHIHKNSCGNPLPFIICRIAGAKKIIAHSHSTTAIKGGIINCLHFIFRPFVRKVSDIKLACSPEAGKWLYKTDNFELVKNGIDVTKYRYDEKRRDEVRKSLGLENSLVIGHVGHFIPPKNHKFMVDIMAEIKNIRSDAVMLFVGRGDLMEETKKYSKEKGVFDSIRFLGARDDVPDLYQAMDVFLFPSLHEGLPFAGVEAQCSGLPCFFSDAISATVILTDTVQSMSLDSSAKEWAENIIGIFENFERKDTSFIISDAGYDAKKMAERMEEIY